MHFENLKMLYVFSCVALCLTILSPALISLIYPSSVAETGEEYSEMWILGLDHTIGDFPLVVSANEAYRIYLGASNHLGEMGYYSIRVKLRNQVEPSADIIDGLPSPLQPVFEYRFFLNDDETREKECYFSFDQVSFEGNVSTVSRLSIDGHSLDIDKEAVRDEENNGFYYQLFFELWLYNAASPGFEFHNRSVGLWINVSSPL